MQQANILGAIRQIKTLRQSKGHYDRMGRNPMIVLTCAGGCGYTYRVRLSRIRVGDVFICDRRSTRDQCRANMPNYFGSAPEFHHQQAGAMAGVTWDRRAKPAPKPQTFMARLLGWLAG